MAGKRNRENVGLPARWRHLHNAYYFRVPKGLEHLWDGKTTFRLGKTLSEAYKTWSDRMLANENLKTIGQLLDRYLAEIVPKKDVSSQPTQIIQIKQLRSVFGDMPLTELKPKHVFQYIEKRKVKYLDEKTGKMRGGMTAAEREKEILSHAFTWAVQWGYIDLHPFKGQLRIEGGNKPRHRYVEDWEIRECAKVTSPRKKGSVAAIYAYI